MLRYALGIAAHLRVLDGLVVNRGTGGSDRAEYCYQVWLKHLALLGEAGMPAVPETVAELGPGDSLGVGLAALLSGARAHVAFDVRRYATAERNERMLDELVRLFARRASCDAGGWPSYGHLLDSTGFPTALLGEERLERSLAPERIEAIRHAIRHGSAPGGEARIEYVVPWDGDPHDGDRENSEAPVGSVDLVLSHSVLEHVDDPPAAHAAVARWLRPGGWASHQIDLTAHGLAREWNGCWAIRSELRWKLLAGARACRINRRPFSEHVRLVEESGLELVRALARRCGDGIGRDRLAPQFRALSDADLRTCGAFLQARKPGG